MSFLLNYLGCIILSSGSILLAISYIEAWISFQILFKGWTIISLMDSINHFVSAFLFLHHRADDARQPLSRVVPISSSYLTPYRVVIILRLIILGFFLQYRVTHPVKDAYGLWLTSVICEIWFALSWLLDQFPKWMPINRETYLDRLALR